MGEENANISEFHTRESIEDFFKQAVDMLTINKETIAAIMAESLKQPGGSEAVFEYLEPFFDELLAKLYSLGIKVENPKEVLTTEFFFNAMPLLTFAAMGDKWARYTGFEEEEVRNYFMDSFSKIYVEYFYKRFFENRHNQ